MKLKKYQDGGQKSFLDFLNNINNSPVVDKGNFTVQTGVTRHQEKQRVNTLKLIRKAEKNNELESSLESHQKAKNFHENNPLNFRKKNPTVLPKESFKQQLDNFGSGIENFYEIPKIGIANDFINPLHIAASGIIAPISQSFQQSEDINNYYKDNNEPLFFNKNVDKYIPYGLAGLSIAMSVPFIKPALNFNKKIINFPKNIGKFYRDIKYPSNEVIKNGKTYYNSDNFLKNNTFENGLNKKEIKFLNKELQDRGILESQRRHPLDIRSTLSKRGIVPEDYNIKNTIKNIVPNIIKGQKAVDNQYVMGDMRKNAFNQYLGISTKNTAYRVHSGSFKNGNNLLYTMPENLINRNSSSMSLSPMNNEELSTMNALEEYYKTGKESSKKDLYNLVKDKYEGINIKNYKDFNPDNIVTHPNFDYGKPIFNGDKVITPTWDYITGTGGGASFVKNGDNIYLKDKWDIQPFSRYKKLPKVIRNFDAGTILGGKSFNLIQEYNTKNGIKQLFRDGGKINNYV